MIQKGCVCVWVCNVKRKKKGKKNMSQNIKNCVVDLGERHAGVLCTDLATFQLLRI